MLKRAILVSFLVLTTNVFAGGFEDQFEKYSQLLREETALRQLEKLVPEYRVPQKYEYHSGVQMVAIPNGTTTEFVYGRLRECHHSYVGFTRFNEHVNFVTPHCRKEIQERFKVIAAELGKGIVSPTANDAAAAQKYLDQVSLQVVKGATEFESELKKHLPVVAREREEAYAVLVDLSKRDLRQHELFERIAKLQREANELMDLIHSVQSELTSSRQALGSTKEDNEKLTIEINRKRLEALSLSLKITVLKDQVDAMNQTMLEQSEEIKASMAEQSRRLNEMLTSRMQELESLNCRIDSRKDELHKVEERLSVCRKSQLECEAALHKVDRQLKETELLYQALNSSKETLYEQGYRQYCMARRRKAHSVDRRVTVELPHGTEESLGANIKAQITEKVLEAIQSQEGEFASRCAIDPTSKAKIMPNIEVLVKVQNIESFKHDHVAQDSQKPGHKMRVYMEAHAHIEELREKTSRFPVKKDKVTVVLASHSGDIEAESGELAELISTVTSSEHLGSAIEKVSKQESLVMADLSQIHVQGHKKDLCDSELHCDDVQQTKH